MINYSEPMYSSGEQCKLSYHGSQIYATNTVKKTFCCGRKNAGLHMQCGSCPER